MRNLAKCFKICSGYLIFKYSKRSVKDMRKQKICFTRKTLTIVKYITCSFCIILCSKSCILPYCMETQNQNKFIDLKLYIFLELDWA